MNSKKEIKSPNVLNRPPVVAVLGHVDHGKTTLLDEIRKTSVAAREHGGVTQHIGAYQIEYQGKKITFIDTPGHAAFEEMRSRGAQVADVALLIVAADEGVKPQTVEAIRHIQNAKIPFIVVISKMDLPQANVEKVKKELANAGVLVEGHGGNIVCQEVSAKDGKGIVDLLEIITLLGELASLEADSRGELSAVVIESQLDRLRGPVATVIVKNGTLRIGQVVVAESVKGKVRSLNNESGERLSEALPATPVQISGLDAPPAIGAILKEGTLLKEVVPGEKKEAINVLKAREEKKEKFKIILKADVAGSLEAICDNLPGEVHIVAKGLGDVSESDLLLAQTTGALLYGFNVKAERTIQGKIDREGLEVRVFKLIYELLDDLSDEIKKLQEKKDEEQIKGRAAVVASFDILGTKVAGLKILDGVLEKGEKIRLLRDGKILAETKISTLKHHKKDIQRADKGMECGVGFDTNLDFRVNDSIEFLAS